MKQAGALTDACAAVPSKSKIPAIRSSDDDWSNDVPMDRFCKKLLVVTSPHHSRVSLNPDTQQKEANKQEWAFAVGNIQMQ
eukprot:3398119-Amphidinium_carterae.1